MATSECVCGHYTTFSKASLTNSLAEVLNFLITKIQPHHIWPNLVKIGLAEIDSVYWEPNYTVYLNVLLSCNHSENIDMQTYNPSILNPLSVYCEVQVLQMVVMHLTCDQTSVHMCKQGCITLHYDRLLQNCLAVCHTQSLCLVWYVLFIIVDIFALFNRCDM